MKILRFFKLAQISILGVSTIVPITIVSTNCSTKSTVSVTDVKLNPQNLSLKPGETKQLEATVVPRYAANKNVSWSSSSSGVATINQNGLVTAITPGEATITVTTEDGGYKATCKVVVEKISVNNVYLNTNKIELVEGETEQLIATVLPEDASNKKVTWTSSNLDVATVDENGLVTAVSGGKAIITVTTVDGGFEAKCEVNIKNSIPVESVKLNSNQLELVEGETEQLIATVLPEDATNKDVTWTSSNPNIATVDENGWVTAVSIGTATISVKTNEGDFEAKCEVNIKNSIPVESVKLNSNQLELVEGETEQLIATVLPEDATNKNVTWTSSNPNIATVNENGVVTAVKEGIPTITVTTEDGGYKAYCVVNVKSPVYVKNVLLNKDELQLFEGETEQLIATIEPEDATNKNVTWSSINPNVATVDENGVVTAISNIGRSIITVTTVDGGFEAKCEVIIETEEVPVNNVELNNTEITLYLNNVTSLKKQKLHSTIYPKTASNKNVTWSSSNPNVATVDENGVVIAEGEGKTTITVTTEDGGYKATCKVLVKNFVYVNNVGLNKSNLDLFVGRSEQLIATIEPEDATNKNVTWSSSKPNVATVDENGVVIAEGEGKTTITVTTEDGGFEAKCGVWVSNVAVENVTLEPQVLQLSVGENGKFTVIFTPEDATNKNVSWSSSNPDAATIDKNGLVTAVGEGDTIITVKTKDGNKTAACEVVVRSIPVEGVKLNRNGLTLAISDTEWLSATVLPEDATNKDVTWTSSNPNIATVDENGWVTAVSIGTATISVKTNEGDFEAKCEVNIKNSIPVESVKLNSNQLELVEGETEQLIATVLPEDATNKNVTWSSINPNVATVDENGVVTAISNGRSIITVTTKNNKTDTCEITVSSNYFPVTDIILDDVVLDLSEGETEQLIATVLPEKATYTKLIWSSDDPSVATVDENGLVTAVGEGDTIITVKTKDGNKTAACEVVVRSIPVEGVKLNRNGLTLAISDTEWLSATVLPENASNKNVTWSSDDPSVATVNENGLVTAISNGRSTITATTEDGGKTYQVLVVVLNR